MNTSAVRQWYAEEILYSAGIESESIFKAFASVPREHFLGKGPWRIKSLGSPYRTTSSDDARHLYHNVLVAIDEKRGLNNGLPSWLAGVMHAANLESGDHVVHIGAGVGYYSAILAEIVGASGSVTAIEVDPQLANIAAKNLREWPWVSVKHANGSKAAFEAADVIFVNAGASTIQQNWIDRLRLGGRLLVPLTYSREAAGRLFRVTKTINGFDAESLQEVFIYPCEGSSDESSQRLLRAAVEKSGWKFKGQLRPNSEKIANDCWLALENFWFSPEQSMDSTQ